MNHTVQMTRMEKGIEIDEGYARHVDLGLGALAYGICRHSEIYSTDILIYRSTGVILSIQKKTLL